ncbi:MAG: TolC family protein [Bacteroidetes bacterium]|nr:TolC family protein [Bacteroidota bacterium]
MNPSRTILVLLIALVCALPAMGQAQNGYTLQQCVETGLKNNIDILRSRNNVERSSTFKKEAFGQFLPSLRGSATWSRSDEDQLAFRANDLLRSRNSYSYNVQAGLTLFDGMRNFNSVDQSIIDYNAAEESFMRTQQTIVYSIQQYYYNVLRMEQLTRVAESNLERSKGQLDRIREMNTVGSVPLADVYRQQVVVGNDELGVIEARNNYQNAMVDLQALLGLSPRPDFTLASDELPSSIEPTEIVRFRSGLGDFDALIKEAVSRRSDYRQAELSLQSAEKGVSVAQSGHYPSLSAFAQYNWNNLELKDFTLYDRFIYGLQLSVPIFSNFQVSGAVERSEIQRMDSEYSLEQLRRSIATEVMKALNALETSEKNIDISVKKLQSAREDQRTAQERYNLGSGTLLDLTTASANLTLAESDVINATFNYLVVQKQMDYQLGRNLN